MDDEIRSQLKQSFPMQNGLVPCRICAYLKIAKYGEDAQETYLKASERKKHSSCKSGHFTKWYTLGFDSLATHW